MSVFQLLLASVVLVAIWQPVCQGFGVAPLSTTTTTNRPLLFQPTTDVVRTNLVAQMTSEAAEEPEATASATEEETASAEEETTTDADADDVADAEPKEDPELVALKQEIESLESDLKAKRRNLAATQDKADDYTKTGYARKVAEMENMRRARAMLQSSSKAGATAATLVEFLPVYDKLVELNDLYSQDAFGKQYGALVTSMKQAFDDLGVTEYSVAVGDAIDTSRMSVVESQHDDAQPADTVLQVLVADGLELQGNLIRLPQVVASLGAEAVAEEEAEPVAEETEPASGESNEEASE